MSLAKVAIEKSKLTNFFVALLIVGGLFTYFTLGRLEDPNFTVKTAIVMTPYPGASAAEVEQEVTDRIEVGLQEMTQLDNLYSISKDGMSIIKVDIKQSFATEDLPQIWDELRKKVRDVKAFLPLSSGEPQVMDDFSFVYGFVLSLTGEDYTYAELEKYAKGLKRELSLVDGVSRAELWGVQAKVVYLDISETKIAKLGISNESVIATLQNQNFVINAGYVNVPGSRMRIEVKGEFDSAQDIGEVLIRRSILDTGMKALANTQASGGRLDEMIREDTELIRIKDIAEVKTEYLTPAMTQKRFNGKKSIAISLANAKGSSIIDTGRGLEKRLEELESQLPAGIQVNKFQWQSNLVKESIDTFVINLAEAVIIVLVVLTLAMGWRMGVIIGSGLILTILGTFIIMALMGLELHRVSLGALVVALGMMVDNSIVVADGIAVRLGKGMDATKAAIESASTPLLPLLGATLIASMAFYPIYTAQSDSGEYAKSLFLVVGISLMLSWLLSVTVTPLHCISLLKAPKNISTDSDPYAGGFFKGFKKLLSFVLRKRGLTMSASIIALIFAVWGFKSVPQKFFPDSTRAQFLIDYWAPEGTPIEEVSDDLKRIEDKIMDDPRASDIGTFIGSGGPRFYLPVDPEFPYPSYAQIVINTPSFAEVNPLSSDVEKWLNKEYPNVMTRVRKYTVGPADTWPFELRITGPGNADLNVLRNLGDKVLKLLHENPNAKHIRTDMRNPVQKMVIDYSQERARWTSVSRSNIAASTMRAHDGFPIGVYRQNDDIYPIIARATQEERLKASGMFDLLQVRPSLSTETLPLSEVADNITLEWYDPIITRWNRRKQIAIQAQSDGITFQALKAQLIDKINEIELPQGYKFEWDGEHKTTVDSQLSLLPGMVPSAVIILLIIVALFNSYKAPFIMLSAIPFAFIGVTLILAPTQTAFGFMALLGAMSLVGMMIKNSIVLLDEINLNLSEGLSEYEAVFNAAVSRIRPVILAALTTVLGVIPLLQDAFWKSMAMTIMAGLTVGTAVTMLIVPVIYCLVNRVKNPENREEK